MNAGTDTELITIAEAIRRSGWSERSLFRLIDRGHLTVHRRPADKRNYLDCEELDRLARPQPLRHRPVA